MVEAPSSDARSPFLAIHSGNHVAANALAFAVRDRFPVSPGHTLVIPRRPVAQWWDATSEEQQAIMELVDVVRSNLLDDEARQRTLPDTPRPAGFNVGFNAGEAAGQTVNHLHVHVIPRYEGDMADPRGGVRHVIPEKGNYLVAQHGAADTSATELEANVDARIALHDAPTHPLGPALADALEDLDRDGRADLLVSFVMVSGLEAIAPSLEAFVDRGGRVRLLTTDYLGITEKRALRQLLGRASELGDRFQVRVYQSKGKSFHPKAYMLWSSGNPTSRAFVGSANLSHSGLQTGIEWSAPITDGASLSAMAVAFDELWSNPLAEPITPELVDAYSEAPRAIGHDVVAVEPATQPVAPTSVQREALDALEHTRIEGFGAGLVVMATGLGKTWLAGFDSSRPGMRRVLFVAHRDEILQQTRSVFRRIRPDAHVGFIQGSRNEADSDIVLATVQTLHQRLDQMSPEHFDYIVIDEVHHASASSYRKVISHFQPTFLLGLTATPERTDNADLLSLCEDNLVFECGLAQGIERDLLVPFRYLGVPDTVDFRPLPWRNRRFDPDALEHAIIAQDRIAAAFDAWQQHRGSRTLGFCVSQRHADVMAAAFRERGVRAVAVHSGALSAPRHSSIDQLSRGELDVVFSVDMFNEGLDVPTVDTVLLLRPTSSPVVFLQQLGRGLRLSDGKSHLSAIDFIGNHKSFLIPARLLLGLGSDRQLSDRQLRDALSGPVTLPPGCEVDYELEAKDTLLDLLPQQRGANLVAFVTEWTAERGSRPTALQTWNAGFNPSTAPGHWLEFLRDNDLLSTDEARAVDHNQGTLEYTSSMSTTKSYKLVALRSLLQAGTLTKPMDVTTLAESSLRAVRRDPRLRADVTTKEIPDPDTVAHERWQTYWRKWPLEHLTNGGEFLLSSESFGLRTVPAAEDDAVLNDLLSEIVDWRMARYLAAKGLGDSIVLKVSHNPSQPILRVDRSKYPTIPEGSGIRVDVGDRVVLMDFVKIAVNVARDHDGGPNILGDILRAWFGPDTGASGTAHAVKLTAGDPWRMVPVTRESGHGQATG
ncbi:MAG: DEAD/DEAH box helicase family protein [Candidatus Nanopelagicales bacterium]